MALLLSSPSYLSRCATGDENKLPEKEVWVYWWLRYTRRVDGKLNRGTPHSPHSSLKTVPPSFQLFGVCQVIKHEFRWLSGQHGNKMKLSLLLTYFLSSQFNRYSCNNNTNRSGMIAHGLWTIPLSRRGRKRITSKKSVSELQVMAMKQNTICANAYLNWSKHNSICQNDSERSRTAVTF